MLLLKHNAFICLSLLFSEIPNSVSAKATPEIKLSMSTRPVNLNPFLFWKYGSVFDPANKKSKNLVAKSRAQIREQMSGPEISKYEKSIQGSGLWSGLDCEIKGSGPIMSNFWGPFFHCLGVKNFFFNFFENNKASSLKIYIIASLQIFFFFNFLNPKNWKNCLFLGLKFQWNLCVNILLAILWSRLAKKPVIIVQKEQRPGCLKRY